MNFATALLQCTIKCELKARPFSLYFESFAVVITHKRVLLGATIIKLFLQEMNGAEYCLRSYRLIFVEFRVLSDCCLSCHWFVDKNAPRQLTMAGKGGGRKELVLLFISCVKYLPCATLRLYSSGIQSVLHTTVHL